MITSWTWWILSLSPSYFALQHNHTTWFACFIKCGFNHDHRHFIKVILLFPIRQILKLLNVTCGFEDPAEAGNSQNDGYIILLHLNEDESDGEDEKIEWNDEIVHVSPTVDTAIALANLQVFCFRFICTRIFHLSKYYDAKLVMVLLVT